MGKRDWPGELCWQLSAVGLELPEREYVFAPPRKFRFDLAWPDHKLALEVDGIVYTRGSHQAGGRHTSIRGLRAECEKSYLAARHGWRVIHILPEQIANGTALTWLEQLLPKAAERQSA